MSHIVHPIVCVCMCVRMCVPCDSFKATRNQLTMGILSYTGLQLHDFIDYLQEVYEKRLKIAVFSVFNHLFLLSSQTIFKKIPNDFNDLCNNPITLG